MLCCNCKKNEAVRKVKGQRNGQTVEENYCFACYHTLFSSVKKEEKVLLCPYCGTTVEEFKEKKLLGCANCYITLKDSISPSISRMQQGQKVHKGKSPTIEQESLETGLSPTFETATDEQILKTRIDRQCRELLLIIEKLKSEGKYEQAKSYADKCSLMQSQAALEEDFIWQ